MAEVKLPAYRRLTKVSERDIVLHLEVVTPLYGGGARARCVDRDLPVRASAIRGQLRFWWRCLYGPKYETAVQMYAAERELWGGLAKRHADIRASRVGVYVCDGLATKEDARDVTSQERKPGDPDGYALWTVKGGDEGNAERWQPGRRFTLVVRPPHGADDALLETVRHTLRAWILFGGVGGRGRRGLGALGLPLAAERGKWLPERTDEASLRAWLAPNRTGDARPHARLAGASLALGAAGTSAVAAWHVAVGWLREFRQGCNPNAVDNADAGDFARWRPRIQGQRSQVRPGRSRWPEPDKLRLREKQHDHPVLAGHRDPAMHWPRAEFGLPLQFRFQDKDRDTDAPYATLPPGATRVAQRNGGSRVEVGTFKLGWALTANGTRLTRLASPLIVKPMQLRDGTFAPLALWLARKLPSAARVGLEEDKALTATAAFGLRPPGKDQPLFSALRGKAELRDAFLDWLRNADNTRPSRGTL